ncbi:hypothetical protein AB0I94_37885 [Streptomyces sp. NPDC050147]|uniref:hypothetical protein n=1 Tax=Streptomyces sp. NPDC050147 TaxID=3155513 RepID=UPI00341DBF10
MTRKTSRTAVGGHPDIRRPDSALVRIHEWAAEGKQEQSAKAAELFETWDGEPWPDALLSRSLFVDAGHGALLGYEQWADADAVPDDAEARTFYRRLSVITDGEKRVPGVIAFAEIDVDGTETAQVMLDTVTQALAADPEPHHPWGISANFHVSTDGRRVVNLSEWTSQEHHQEGFADTTRSSRPAWLRLRSLPGVRPIGVRRFRLHTHAL